MKKVQLLTLILTAQMFFTAQVQSQCNLGTLSNITGIFSACPGNSIQYTVAPVTNATTYTWNLPAGATINGQNPFTSAATTVTVDYDLTFTPPGNICVFANNNICTTGPLCKPVVSSGPPSGASSITGNIAACPGDLFTYSVTNTPGRTYAWTAPNGATINSGQGSNQVTVAFGGGFTSPGNLCVVVSNGCAVSAPRCQQILLNTPPTPTNVTGPATVCGGNSGVYNVPTNPRATSYLWSVPPGATIAGQGTPTVTVTFPPGFIYGSVLVRYVNSCATSQPAGINVRSAPATPASMSGITAGLCGGSTTYTTPLIPGATSYTWTVNNSASITGGQNTNTVTVNFPANYNTGKVCVFPVNSCGTGTPRCLQLKKEIDILVQPVNDTNCYQNAISFNADAMGLNLTYQWRKNGTPLADGGNISGSQTQVLNINPADSLDFGSYTVAVDNGCAPQKVSNIAEVFFNYIPVSPVAILGGNPVTCPGTNGVVYSVPAQPDIDSYDWSTTDGANIISGQGTNSIVVDFDSTINSGYYIILKVSNECGNAVDSVSTWTRYSISTPTFVGGPDFICPGQTGVVYSTQSINGADNYTWAATAGINIISGQGTNSVTVDFDPGFTGGDLSVNANNICYTTPDKIKTIGLDIPSQPGSITGQVFSTCNTTLTYTTPAVAGATDYTWILPAGATVVGPANNNSVDIQFTNPGNAATLCVTANSSCLSSPQRCISIKARPEALSVITANPAVFCANQAGVQFSVAAPPVPSTTVTWALPLGSTIQSGQSTPSIVADMGSTNGDVLATPVNSCSSGSTRKLTVNFPCRNANGIEETAVNNTEITVAPSPAHDYTVLKFATVNVENYVVELVDLLGKSLMRAPGTSKEGMNEHKLHLDKIPSGIYIISLKKESGNRFIKLQVN